MLASVLSFSPDLADQVSEYCENHSDGKYLSLTASCFPLLSYLLCAYLLTCRTTSPPGTYQRALGLDPSELRGCGQDVLKAARPVDDLDGSMDCSKKGYMTCAYENHLLTQGSNNFGYRYLQRLLGAHMVRRYQRDAGGDCDTRAQR